MSDWTRKFVKGNRIELRCTVTGKPRPAKHWSGSVSLSAQVLIVVTETEIRISMNGTAEFTRDQLQDMYWTAVEAQRALSLGLGREFAANG